MAAQGLDAESSALSGQPVTERAARFLPGLRMLVLGIALLLAGAALAVADSASARTAPQRP